MVENILAQIDAEIARLQQAREIISSTFLAPKHPGRPLKSVAPTKAETMAPKRRRSLSPEARERIRQAQIKRWASTKRDSK